MRADHADMDDTAAFAQRWPVIEQQIRQRELQLARAEQWEQSQAQYRPSELPVEEHRAVFEPAEPMPLAENDPVAEVTRDHWHVAKHAAVLLVVAVGFVAACWLLVKFAPGGLQ